DVEHEYHKELDRMAFLDQLTQIHNARYFDGMLAQEFNRSRRNERDVSILLLDVDHLKRINDVEGHLAGSFVLCEVARVVQSALRPYEVFARYGGDEFAIMLPETSISRAVDRGETLLQSVQGHSFMFQGAEIRTEIRITMSAGAAGRKESDGAASD